MNNLIASAGRVATGLITGAIFAEMTAIGTNMVFDDGEYLYGKAVDKLAPKPKPIFSVTIRKKRK